MAWIVCTSSKRAEIPAPVLDEYSIDPIEVAKLQVAGSA